MKIIRTYSELLQIPTFEERFNYLRLNGRIGENTFGGHRYLNQLLYNDPRWKKTRNDIIIRDDGCDLAIHDREIRAAAIYIHHLNPITIDDILESRSCVFDPENLICSSFNTHAAIHYGNGNLLILDPIVRTKNDTCPWRC